MPTRIVREGILTSPRVNRLSFGAELFYRRLMTVADDYGRFHASLPTLRGACFPVGPERVTEKQILGWLTECLASDIQLLSIYESSGCRYLQIANFGQQTRGKSKYPDPPLLSNCLATDNQMLSKCEANAKPSRRRIEYAESESESESDAKPETSRATRFALNSIPDDWEAYAESRWEFDHNRIAREFEAFQNHFRANGKRMLDWYAAWRNWCGNAEKFASSRRVAPKAPTLEEMMEG